MPVFFQSSAQRQARFFLAPSVKMKNAKGQAAPSNIVFWVLMLGIAIVFLLALAFIFFDGFRETTLRLPGL